MATTKRKQSRFEKAFAETIARETKKQHWYEVKRYTSGKYDPEVTTHKSLKATLNAVEKAKATGKYEAVVWDEYDDGIID